jgi:uncharacterized protein (DUF433 family)
MERNDSMLPVGAASWVLRLRKSEVDRILDEGSLPPGVFVRRRNRRFVTREGLPYVKFAAAEKGRLSLRFRKAVLRKMAADGTYLWRDRFVEVDLTPVKTEMDDRVLLLRRAEEAVVGDPDIRGGELCLKGTRMPVYMVAEMRKAGTSAESMIRSHPSLTPELIEIASTYAEAYPKRGRPSEPAWRKNAPVRRVSVRKQDVEGVIRRSR